MICDCLCSVPGVICGLRSVRSLHVGPPVQHSGDADRCQHQSGVLWRLPAHARGASRGGMYKVGGILTSPSLCVMGHCCSQELRSLLLHVQLLNFNTNPNFYVTEMEKNFVSCQQLFG